MDFVEQHTQEFLKASKLGDFEYEPNGDKTFPDLPLGSETAVECTRLPTVREIDGYPINLTEISTLITRLNAC